MSYTIVKHTDSKCTHKSDRPVTMHSKVYCSFCTVDSSIFVTTNLAKLPDVVNPQSLQMQLSVADFLY